MSDQPIEWPKPKWIKVFLATAKDGNQSAAAKRLGCSPSVVSRNITALEEWARTPLFTRDQPAELTELGIQLRDLAEQVQRQFEEFRSLPMVAKDSARKPVSAKSLRV